MKELLFTGASESMFAFPREYLQAAMLVSLLGALHGRLPLFQSRQPRPRLLLKSKRVNSLVRVTVEDNGPGIAADIVPHIFEPFFTTKEVGSGTGLGLSIAHSIIADHWGQLSYESVPGGGARFVMELPMQESLEPAAREGAPPIQPASTEASGIHPARVLVLDDEPDIAELLGVMLIIPRLRDARACASDFGRLAGQAVWRIARRRFQSCFCLRLDFRPADGWHLAARIHRRLPAQPRGEMRNHSRKELA